MRARERKAAARRIIRRLQEIAHNDMLIRGMYFSEGLERPDLAEAGAVCGGRRACLVGSFMLAAGADRHEARRYLGARDEFAALYPGATEAREALNEAALRTRFRQLTGTSVRQARADYRDSPDCDDPMENLFERARVPDEKLPDLVLEVTECALELLR